jgi:hypothetical protein
LEMLQSRKWLTLSFAPILPLLGFAIAMRISPEFRASLKGVQGLQIYVAVAATLILAWVIYASLKWWRSVDEAVREAHKSAWFWGGLAGLCIIILPLVMSVGLTGGQTYQTVKTSFHVASGFGEFAAGIITTLLAMLVGYAISWALWWWRRG